MAPKQLLWTSSHQQRYDAVYNYLKNTLHLDINKDDFVESVNNRLLFKYIMIIFVQI